MLADQLRKYDWPVKIADRVHIDHHGNVRGTNAYKDCDTIILTGRNQPPLHGIEGVARANWWDDSNHLEYDDVCAAKPSRYQKQAAACRHQGPRPQPKPFPNRHVSCQLTRYTHAAQATHHRVQYQRQEMQKQHHYYFCVW